MGRAGTTPKIDFIYESGDEQAQTGIAAEAEETAAAGSAPKDVPESRIWVYIGPSIRGVATNGSIYRGTRDEVLKALEVGLGRFPKLARFIVADCDVARARERLSSGKGALSVEYDALVREIAENK